MADETSPSITREAGPDRFQIAVDGDPAGLLRFVDDDAGRRIMFHTEVSDDHAGEGLGGHLVTAALDRTREEGLRVVPVCPYVKRFVERHAEYADLVDPVTPDALQRASAAATSS